MAPCHVQRFKREWRSPLITRSTDSLSRANVRRMPGEATFFAAPPADAEPPGRPPARRLRGDMAALRPELAGGGAPTADGKSHVGCRWPLNRAPPAVTARTSLPEA